MRFIVQPIRRFPSRIGPRAAILVPNDWDDRGYRTSYDLWIRLVAGDNPVEIGRVKIARLDQVPGPSPLPTGIFANGLPAELGSWVSLGQDDLYYEKIKDLGTLMCREVLTGLYDLAFDLSAFGIARGAGVVESSLLRSVSDVTVATQFHRITMGGTRLVGYRFDYHPRAAPGTAVRGPLEFEVTPESVPPTNIHVLIGRNGVGKTTLLRSLAEAAVHAYRLPEADAAWIEHLPHEDAEPQPFANVILVAFSAFDLFTDIAAAPDSARYMHVGLVRQRAGEQRFKSQGNLADEFIDSFTSILTSGHYDRWLKAVQTLGSDPQFEAAVLTDCGVGYNMLEEELSIPESDHSLRTPSGRLWHDVFMSLSSGHAIVLLTLTRLVDLVAERTLVLLDEPEAHLHPPLLSSFIRALSDLLTDRNGVAVAATHSPVVLQEVPKSCVYKMSRHGRHSRARRPHYETYGENVGILTHEIFGLEVMRSGFYAEIEKAAARFDDYGAVVEHFDGQLGDEARGLVRILLAEKQRENT
ncbi:AAA family ATPase [Streptomyces sp. NPDC056194]|uniref:AAA family ATPase n=1 Tax=Streptomyces sp. NPDC056194 TaxID=3345744 RepID=UPI0035D84E42